MNLPGGARYEQRGEIGIGGAGAVYRVFDHDRGGEVALKVLRRVSGSDLYRFKREFRTLAGLTHPNLVALYDLYAVGTEWMFTMELVDGVRFDRWVRAPRPGSFDEPRLRAALAQLVDAVVAIHALGKIHRDLKPSNVLVDGHGRLVVLDFGLVTDAALPDVVDEPSVVGTSAYMSPEQAAAAPVTPATDWYAVGVMLFEALTGTRPFGGRSAEIRLRKQLDDVPRPSTLVAGVPADLDELCLGLLRRDPAQRPDEAAILAALAMAPSPATLALRDQPALPPAPPASAHRALRDAFAASRDHMVYVAVSGDNLAELSAMVTGFVDEVRAETGAIAVTARLDPREHLVLPAFDQLLDQLGALWLRLPKDDLEELLANAAPLARAFPALRRLPMLRTPAPAAGAVTAPPANDNDAAQITRALTTLERVVTRFATHQPLIFVIEAQHHSTEDNLRLLGTAMTPASRGVPVLLVGTFDLAFSDSAALRSVRRWASDGCCELREIELY